MAKGKQLDAKLTISGDVDSSLRQSLSDAETRVKALSNAAKRAEGFTVMKGAIANLVADGFQSLICGAGQAISALASLAAETRETRQDLASLNTAYQQNNFSAEQANSTARSLFGVFGESDRAVEAANNIARMAKSQQDLNDWTRISTGAWAVFQDALPVENLAEAAGETAKTGTVVGGLADALNWNSKAAEMFAGYMGGDVVTAEDAFNVALSECSSEQERQALITNTLLTLYGEAGDQYRVTAGSLIEANEATWDAGTAQADLGAILEPMTTAWTKLKTTLLKEAAPALERMAEVAKGALEWLGEHPNVMKGIVTAAGVLGGVLTAAGTAMVAVGAASAIASAGMLPIIGVAGGVAVGIGAMILIVKNLGNIWEWLKGKASELQVWMAEKWEAIKTIVGNAANGAKTVVQNAWADLKGLAQSAWNGFKDGVQGVWSNIVSAAKDFAGDVVSAIKGKWQSLTSILTAPFDTLSGLIDSLSSKLGGLVNKASRSSGSIRSLLPTFATGGFTAGPSIAGEAGTEAVISFDPRYRADNLRYWQQAGSLMGVDYDRLSLSGGNSTTTNMGGITFAPSISITGDAKKQDVIDAIRATYPEFMDLIEEVLADRKVGAYG